MSLGVLNNLSAMYAENNLNNTTNSLNTVLQQLSSGSKINSGADDAAGLSLVDGLQANSQALAQSQTNAQEGVGLLQVADGALSQVTSLLNRAVTLATEASNGTLNSSQDTAANQEYQSILSEINNIGTTTTYNDTSVFGQGTTNIYTGDSSTQGASIDALNISSLSSSNVGDTGGVMAYSNGNDNVFLNLSGTTNAQATDTLNSSGSTSINVNYLVKGADGTENSASTSISVGGTTNYANTANGLIDAINGAGLGLSASFTTQAQAGVAGGGTQTGIQITGGLVSVGVAPSSVSTGGTLSLSGSSASSLLAQGQTVAIQSGSQTAISVAVTPTIQTLSDLAAAINTQSTANAANVNSANLTQVVATVVTSATGTQSLSLVDSNPSGGALSVNDTAGSYTPTISGGTVATGSAVVLSYTAGSTGNAAGSPNVTTYAGATLGVSSITNNATGALSGTLSLSNGNGTVLVTMNNADMTKVNDATHIYLSAANSTLTGLANAINSPTIATAAAATLGVTAQVGSTGLVLTSLTTNTTIAGTSSLTATPLASLTNNIAGAPANAGTPAVTTISLTGGNGLTGTDTLAAGTSVVVTNGSVDSPGTPITFTVGGNTANDTATQFYTGAGSETITGLVGIMNGAAGKAAAGLSGAVLSGANGDIVLTSASVGTTIAATSTVIDQENNTSSSLTAAIAQNTTGSSAANTTFATTGVVQDANLDPITAGANDTLSGTMTLTNGSSSVLVTMGYSGANSNDATHIYLSSANSTLAGLAAAINSPTIATAAVATLSGSGIDAGTFTAAVNATDNGMVFSTTAKGTQIVANTTNLSTVSAMNYTNPVQGGLTTYSSGTIALADGGKITGAAATYAGQVTVQVGANTDTFIMGAGSNSIGASSTIYTGANSLASLVTAINNEGSGGTKLGTTNMDLTATTDLATGGIFIQSDALNTPVTVVASGLTATMAETESTGATGAVIVPANVAANVVFGTGTHNAPTDVISGTISIANSSGVGGTTVFTMGSVANNNANPAATGLGTNAVAVNGNTWNDLMNAITADSSGAYAGTAGVDVTVAAGTGGNGMVVTSQNATSTISAVASTLQDQYSMNTIVDPAGTAASGTTYGSATISTGQAIGASDTLNGAITLSNGGSNYTFTMAASSTGSTATAINTNGTTISALQQAISQSGIGITANIVNGTLQLQSNNADTTIAVHGVTTLADTQTEGFTGGSGTAGTSAHFSTASATLAGALSTAVTGDAVAGSITLTGNGGTQTFTMGAANSGAQTVGGTTGVGSSNTPFSENLGALASAITADTTLGITANVTSTGLSFTSNVANTTNITATTSGLQDTSSLDAQSTVTLGSFRSESDTLSAGAINFSLGGTAEPTVTVANNTTVSGLISQINGTNNPYGVTATWNSTTDSVVLKSDTYGAAGNLTTTSSTVTDTTSGRSLSYVATSAYDVGISNSTATTSALYDSSDQTDPMLVATNTKYTNFAANTGASSGIATISYSNGAGQSLSATDLSNQTDAQASLTALNKAITDVASQDGYIGAQINTLNAVSSVLSTQQQNVVSAQNAVQATDYASATSNMSKYEILSQTGISALAQANSMSQEVTKLLQ